MIAPSLRADEIGEVERALARMQATPSPRNCGPQAPRRTRLAASKINHDPRNMLAAAQLMSDQLVETRDASIRCFAPAPHRDAGARHRFPPGDSGLWTGGGGDAGDPPGRAASQLVAEQGELLGLSDKGPLRLENEVPADLVAACDPDQIARVLTNLMRNAAQALTQAGAEARAADPDDRRCRDLGRGRSCA